MSAKNNKYNSFTEFIFSAKNMDALRNFAFAIVLGKIFVDLLNATSAYLFENNKTDSIRKNLFEIALFLSLFYGLYLFKYKRK